MEVAAVGKEEKKMIPVTVSFMRFPSGTLLVEEEHRLCFPTTFNPVPSDEVFMNFARRLEERSLLLEKEHRHLVDWLEIKGPGWSVFNAHAPC